MNYSIKVSKDSRPEFDNLLVWLSDDNNPSITHDVASHNPEYFTYALICYKHSIMEKLKLNGGDADLICTDMIEEFKNDFDAVTRNVMRLVDFDTMQQMHEIVELFICAYVYSCTDEL